MNLFKSQWSCSFCAATHKVDCFDCIWMDSLSTFRWSLFLKIFSKIFIIHYNTLYRRKGGNIDEKPTQFHDFSTQTSAHTVVLNSNQCPYHRKRQCRQSCVGVWGFSYKWLRVRHEWRHITKLNFSIFLIYIWLRLVKYLILQYVFYFCGKWKVRLGRIHFITPPIEIFEIDARLVCIFI